MAKDVLKPLKWLIGKWVSKEGFMKMPGRDLVHFKEEFQFEPSACKKKLVFDTKRFTLDTNESMHEATGFVIIKPGTSNLSFALAHDHGVITVEEGCCAEGSLEVASIYVSTFSSACKPELLGIKRQYKYYDGHLQVIAYVVNSDDPTLLFEHIRASFEKC